MDDIMKDNFNLVNNMVKEHMCGKAKNILVNGLMVYNMVKEHI